MTTITINRATVEQALEALEIGYEVAKAEADRYYIAMAGFRPESHAKMDAEVQQIAQSITALRAALAEPVQEPVALKWLPAPRKTEWGFGMVSADVEIDRDHTLTLYCEDDQTAKVDAMFRRVFCKGEA